MPGNLPWVCAQRSTVALSVVLFPWQFFAPVSALCLPHLITSQCLTTVREGSHEEHHSLICLTERAARLYEVCVCACLCTHGRQWISQKGEEQRNEGGWRSLIAQHIWRGPGEDSGRLDRVRSRHLARTHNIHTNPHSVPLLVSRVALRFDLDTVG